ncbi:anoctamin-1 isoform X3 [Lucilia cuprina]|uniref:anoctamin-1 isoform X3 n=1 Tax=Lucilia cuprina TaxID=7375 RepID=UPI001F056F80|nr:anoctamin-1 isoform X3 [Lucilia cuprina]
MENEKIYNNYTNTATTAQDTNEDDDDGKGEKDDKDESEFPLTNEQENEEEEKLPEQREDDKDDNEIDIVVIDADHNEPSAIVNKNVNKSTAVEEHEEEEMQKLLEEEPAKTTENLDQNLNDNQGEEDEESTTFEPPYTAPLAPLDMELIERLNREREAKRHSSSAGRRRDSRSPWTRKSVDSTKTVAAMFMEGERLNLDAGRRAHEFQTIVDDLTPAVHDSHRKPSSLSMTNANTAESFYIDSTTSTLLLSSDNEPSSQTAQNARIHNFTNHNNHYNNNNCNSNNNSRNPATTTTSIPMTKLAPFEDPPEIELSAPNDYFEKHEPNPSLFFDDGVRSIDFVLVYKIDLQHQVLEEDHAEKRRVFEANLEAEGLEIERVCKEKEQIYFVKIHAPLEVLRRYAEILKLRMPMKEIPGMSVVNRSTRSVFSSLKGIFTFFMKHIYVDERYFPRRAQRFTAIYSRDKEYLFDIRQDNFFTPAVRSRIVQFILDRQRFTPKNKDEMAFGIERLVTYNVYCAAYPLHDGEIYEKNTMRHTLSTHWASISKWYRYQPLDYVKEYFGVKIGLYFAWLGFYTYMLMLAAVVGLICFLYSLLTLKDYVPVQEICSNTQTNITMCPLCNWCNFWDLKETCFYAKISYLIDNPSTLFFTVFMSFWAALFLELWKRYSAEITHRWDLTGFDVHEEHPRPQYLARLQHLPNTRTDYVTNMKEPTVPFWRMKFPAAVFSFSVVLLLIALAFVALVGVVIYRVSMLAILKVGDSPMNTSSAIMLASASAAFLNLCFLYVLNYLYNHLADYLTEKEMWRTQTQFDDSLTLKIYLLQFVNYYASIFYIAFFKGKFVGHPAKYHKIFDERQEECSSGGCLTELCIQLAIIMIGKQAFNSILEVIMPKIWRKIMALKVGLTRCFSPKEDKHHKDTERWWRDLKLLDWGPRSLFPEYLEMVLQYGFVTIFVAAFPLAPFFALLNNILEMRLDANKLLTHHRRPVSQRVRDIGVWYRILDCIGKLSVITNGFIIAFTSDMIPRWVYRGLNSEDGSLHGYLNFTLSEFRTSDSDSELRSLSIKYNITSCKYTDFREPPTSPNKYYLSSTFYIILACRLGFVVVFENFVALVMILVRWCIPDMSVELRDQIRREVYITNEIIIEQEARRARFERAKRSSSVRLRDSESNTPDNANDRFIRIEQLLACDLSQSQMDLIIHGDNADTGIQGENC